MARRFGVKGALRVGFLEGATYPDGTSVATIAAIQNFGAPAKGIPPRPFFSDMVASKSPGWPDAVGRILQANGGDGAAALELMGQGIAGQLQDAITDGAYAPNSPVTDLLKYRFPMGGQTFKDVLDARRDVANGESAPAGKPLIHTGNLQNSVDYEVGE
ncbi:MAG: hypothetical protein EBR82_11300 [Caulobacteraceae bacterium]|nr:hypothetical protein [Caulobacteraceae bacterium]